MLMKKTSDLLIAGAARQYGVRFVFCDVTESARALARSHLAGPTAARVIAESLAGVSLLGADLTFPEQTVALSAKTDGPIESILVEASFEGTLRGFTGKKLLEPYDGEASPDMADVYGSRATVRIISSTPGHVISQSGFDSIDPSIPRILCDYFTHALQRTSTVAVDVDMVDNEIDIARAFLIELMPDGLTEKYEVASAIVRKPSFRDALFSTTSPDALCKELGLGDENVMEPARPLSFACRCSRERALSMIMQLSRSEREDMAKSGRATSVFCHMCGRGFSFQPAEFLPPDGK